MIRDERPIIINMEVPNAVKSTAHHGIFCGRDRIGNIEDDVPEAYLDKHLALRFHSGLMLNCIGRDVARLREGRE